MNGMTDRQLVNAIDSLDIMADIRPLRPKEIGRRVALITEFFDRHPWYIGTIARQSAWDHNLPYRDVLGSVLISEQMARLERMAVKA